ncbi:hypothetical protein [Schauerella aestuarii]|uniref:hypothetical protein n=1 Tax=Schauerella aestuarii TaxID=2511204 RepID=UPI001368B908|nr:hypothetical protein [Achromobacter aestuarii]MYZ43201.1 hypothetical protein [Achromobacter aestuarii]
MQTAVIKLTAIVRLCGRELRDASSKSTPTPCDKTGSRGPWVMRSRAIASSAKRRPVARAQHIDVGDRPGARYFYLRPVLLEVIKLTRRLLKWLEKEYSENTAMI